LEKIEKKNKEQNQQLGEIHSRFPVLRFLPVAIALAIGIALLAAFATFKNIPPKNVSSDAIQKKLAISTVVLKNDPEWQKKYCKEQLATLPQAPFEYTGTEETKMHGTIAPNYIEI